MILFKREKISCYDNKNFNVQKLCIKTFMDIDRHTSPKIDGILIKKSLFFLRRFSTIVWRPIL